MLVLASVTESLVNIAWHFVRDAGLPAVFVLMVAESACIPIPSEATMLFAGFAVADPGASAAHHHLTLAGIVAAGVLGNLVGSWIAYGVGRAGRLELVERHGHWLHVKPSHLEWADRWFARYGAPAIFFSRMLPIVRTFISLPAGVAKMPFWRFTALTIAGCIPWVLALALVGQSVGSNWEDVRHGLEYVDYVIAAAFVAGAVYAVVRWRRGGRTQTGDTTEATTPGNSALGRRDRAEGAPDATPAAEADLDATPAAEADLDATPAAEADLDATPATDPAS